jgi:AraC-like DNA-binding protein
MRTTDAFSRATVGVLETADGAWRYAVKTPRPPCNRWIAKLWELDGACPPACERELPRADISLIVNLAGRHAVVDHDDPGAVRMFKDAWVSGLQERAFVTASGGRAWLCGARLTVEGAYRVFGVAPQQLANRIVDLDAIHGGAAHSVVDAIRNAVSVEMRLTILGDYLVAQAMRTCRWDASVAWALERIVRSGGCTTVAGVAGEIGWSRKHLHRRFVAQVGVGPKTWVRLLRFHAALGALENVREESLAAAAQRLGYFDQAHLAREFHLIAGMTITDYRRARAFAVDYGFARQNASHSSKT